MPFKLQQLVHLAISEKRTIEAFRRLIYVNGIVRNARCLQLLFYALINVTRCLANLQQAGVGLVVDGVGVDAKLG